MKCLHISDLHIKQCTPWNSMEMWFKNFSETNHIDFIVITGDLHSFKDDYEETKIFLNNLLKFFNLTKHDIFIVPGNHDVDSKPTWKYRDECLECIKNSVNNNEDSYCKYINDLKQCFGKYEQFIRAFYENDNPYQNPLDICNLVWNGQVNILHINSALICDGKEHKQIVDIRNLSELRINNNLPIIAIGHHALHDIYESHQKNINRIFSNLNVSVYLCGDSHKISRDVFNYKNDELELPCLVSGITALDPTDDYSDKGFNILSINDGSSVNVDTYIWNDEKLYYQKKDRPFEVSFAIKKRSIAEKEVLGDEKYKGFGLIGYSLIGGRGIDGIKYFWKKGNNAVESIAFNQRVKDNPTEEDLKISAYTCSVSNGCYLHALNKQCKFCETGNIPYNGFLSAEEIALQNIFMAAYDADCPSFPEVRDHKREFAFMGQGEPGFMYQIIRESIILTDIAMEKINQPVYRYIISTCGVQGLIPSLIQDIKSGVFKNKVTIHYSLNAVGRERDFLMPVNYDYNYADFINDCKLLYAVTKEKISVGIILFNKFRTDKDESPFSINKENLSRILDSLDSDMFRIDLCDYNEISTGEQFEMRNEDANKLLKYIRERGFQAKMFSSYGRENSSGCGMLHSDTRKMSKPGNTTLKNLRSAIHILQQAMQIKQDRYTQ